MKDGVNATPLPTVNTPGYIDHAAFLGTITPDTNKIPKHLFPCYLNIYNNYVKAPWLPDRTEANTKQLNQDDARYGCCGCHLKNMWSDPRPPETELCCFFFQAEDGIRDLTVTGVQTCALPISGSQRPGIGARTCHRSLSSA